MEAVTRIEHYLARILEQESTDLTPVTRIEHYLDDIASGNESTLEPVTRLEYYLARISGIEVEVPEPVTRLEMYLYGLIDADYVVPAPVTRLEYFLADWVEQGTLDWQTFVGNPLQFNAPKSHVLKSLKVNFSPVQDLHGYANPWPLGGGKNKYGGFTQSFPFDLNGITYSLNSDGSIHVQGKATGGQSSCPIFSPNGFSVGSGTWTISVTSSTNLIKFVVGGSSNTAGVSYAELTTGGTKTFTTEGGGTTGYNIVRVENGNEVNADFYIQFEEGSSPTAWTPYENLCPITGWTGVDIYDTGENLLDMTKMVAGIIGSDGELDYATTTINSQTADTITWTTIANWKAISTDFIPVKEGFTLFASLSETVSYVICTWYDSSKSLILREVYRSLVGKTAPSGAKYVRYSFQESSAGTYTYHNIMLNYGNTAKPFVLYNPASWKVFVTWQDEAGTVYGGYLLIYEDGSCDLVTDRFLYVYDGTESFSKSGTALNGFYNNLQGATPHDWPRMWHYGDMATPITTEKSSMFKMTRDVNEYKTSYGYCFLDSGMNFDVPPETFGTTTTTFKNKLAELYAAGTPVSVWAKVQNAVTYHLPSLEEAIRCFKGLNIMWSNMNENMEVQARAINWDNATWQDIVYALNNNINIPIGTEFEVEHDTYGDENGKIQFVVRRSNVDKVHGHPNRPTCTIQTKYLLHGNTGTPVEYLQYDRPEAFIPPLETAISANSVVKMTLDVAYESWTAGDYSFTPTVDLPIGTVLCINEMASAALTSRKVQAYDSPKCLNKLGEWEISSGSELATVDLGTWQNSPQRVSGGSSNDAQSNLFQWLNADGIARDLWTPQTDFDLMTSDYTATLKGFYAGFPTAFKSALGLADIHNLTNNVYETGGYQTGEECTYTGKFWLASRKEVYGTEENSNESAESQFQYFADGGSEKLTTKSGSVSSYWLRTPHASYADTVRSCNPTKNPTIRGRMCLGSIALAPVAILSAKKDA